jgi:hypothetical protein
MKKLLMIFSFVAVSAMSYAQQDQRRTFDPEKRAEHVVGGLVDTLELDEMQAASLKESYIMLFTAQQSKRQSSTRKGDEMKMALEAHLVRVKEVLNDDKKFDMYTQLKSDRSQGWKSKDKQFENRRDISSELSSEERANKIADRKVGYIADTLQLNEVQKKALHEVYVKQALQKMEQRKARRALHEKNKEAHFQEVDQILQSEEKFETYKTLQREQRKGRKTKKRQEQKPLKKQKNKGR